MEDIDRVQYELLVDMGRLKMYKNHCKEDGYDSGCMGFCGSYVLKHIFDALSLLRVHFSKALLDVLLYVLRYTQTLEGTIDDGWSPMGLYDRMQLAATKAIGPRRYQCEFCDPAPLHVAENDDDDCKLVWTKAVEAAPRAARRVQYFRAFEVGTPIILTEYGVQSDIINEFMAGIESCFVRHILSTKVMQYGMGLSYSS